MMTAETEKPGICSSGENDVWLTATPVYADCPSVITDAGPEARTAWEHFTAGGRFRPSTRSAYRRTALKFLKWLEAERIGLMDVIAHDVERFLDGQELCDRSKVAYRTAIRRFFDVLVDHKVVSTNPADEAGRGTDDPLGGVSTDSGEAISMLQADSDQPPTLAEMKAAIRELDPPIMDDNPEMLDAGVVLLAGLHLGTKKLMPISRFTGVSPWRVGKFAERLRANGVWTEDGKTAGEWDDPEGGLVALLLDILVATGITKRCDGAIYKGAEPLNDAHETAPAVAPAWDRE